MGKKILFLAILLSFLELWSHITICAAYFNTFPDESSYPITTEDSLSDMVNIRPNPAYVGDQVYFTCDFFQSTNTHGDSIKELHWLKNGESIFYYYADSYQSPLPGYEDKIHQYDMTDYHYYMWMVVEPSDEDFYQCRFFTNESDVIHSHEVYLTIASSEPCGTNLTDSVGNITTPLYPNTYPPHTHCVWNIIAPEQYYVKLTFVDFELDGNYPICYGDYVWIWDGKDDKGMYCKGSPNTIYSTSNTMVVIFHSDKWYNFRGFLAEYEFQLQTTPYTETLPSTPEGTDTWTETWTETWRNTTEPCGTNLTDQAGNFTTPLYPNPYPPYVHCVWTIIAPEQYYIKLTFVDFELESHHLCSFDYVYIWDGNTHLGTFCKQSPNTIYSTTNNMTVIFGSDVSVQLRGFLAEYEFLSEPLTYPEILHSTTEWPDMWTETWTETWGNATEPCGTNLTDQAGNFTTPLYPNVYPTNVHCVWNIVAPEQFYIKLTFVDFELEGHACHYDYVLIWDGNTNLGRFCEQGPQTTYSTNNTMRVIFHSDSVIQLRGFLAKYEFLSQPLTYTEISHTEWPDTWTETWTETWRNTTGT